MFIYDKFQHKNDATSSPLSHISGTSSILSSVCVCVCVCVCVLSCFSRIRVFVTPWTVAHQAPLSMGCSRQKYWSGLPFPSPGDLPDPGIKPMSLASPALVGGFSTTSATWEAPFWEEAI